MDSRQFHLHDGKKGSALAIRVTPRARRNEISGILNDGTVKVRLTSSSEETKANDALVSFLSEILGVPSSQIEIVAGATGRDKLVSILDMDAGMVQDCIIRKMSE